MAKKHELKTIGTAAMVGTAALLRTAALLSPLQVCGAAGDQGITVKNNADTYNWDTQISQSSHTDPSMKEGTATGSSGDNHLEDWND